MTETEARQRAIKYGALCGQCLFFFQGKKKGCERYQEIMSLYEMPVAYCAGFQKAETKQEKG